MMEEGGSTASQPTLSIRIKLKAKRSLLSSRRSASIIQEGASMGGQVTMTFAPTVVTTSTNTGAALSSATIGQGSMSTLMIKVTTMKVNRTTNPPKKRDPNWCPNPKLGNLMLEGCSNITIIKNKMSLTLVLLMPTILTLPNLIRFGL